MRNNNNIISNNNNNNNDNNNNNRSDHPSSKSDVQHCVKLSIISVLQLTGFISYHISFVFLFDFILFYYLG